jgi:hypothetical protein
MHFTADKLLKPSNRWIVSRSVPLPRNWTATVRHVALADPLSLPA